MQIEIKKIEVGNRFRKDLGDLQELADSIKEQGLLQPIGITKNNELVFGHRRMEACKLLGLKEIEAKAVDVTSIIEGEQTENEVRKEFTKTERNSIADAITELIGNRQGQRTDILPLSGKEVKGETKDIAAKKAGFKSGDEYRRVKQVINSGVDELKDAMDSELVDVTNAAILAKKEPAVQKEVIKKIKSGESKSIKEAEKDIKKEKRAKDIEKQRQDIKKGVVAVDGKFDVIAIDPPWNYGNSESYDPDAQRGTTTYPEMSTEDIKKIILPASDNCVLWLWTTHAFLKDAFMLMENWGFDYKATMVWNKNKMGIGRWLRMQCEFCLLGIKGKPTWDGGSVRDIITESRREHSRKPDAFYEIVDGVCIGRKLEYFAREPREGWEVFGNDINKFGAK